MKYMFFFCCNAIGLGSKVSGVLKRLWSSSGRCRILHECGVIKDDLRLVWACSGVQGAEVLSVHATFPQTAMPLFAEAIGVVSSQFC